MRMSCTLCMLLCMLWLLQPLLFVFKGWCLASQQAPS